MSSIKYAIVLAVLLVTPALADDALLNLMHRFNREIPVQLAEGDSLIIGIRGEAILECYRGTKLAEVYYFGDDLIINYRENGLEVSDDEGSIALGLAEIRCKPRLETSNIVYNGHAYRGYFKALFKDSPSEIQLINVIDIEDYLKGVLPGEIGDRTQDEYESVKAQAVAARTYAIWKMTDSNSSRKLQATIADQLYTGLDSEKDLLTKGIEETRGEILVYKDRPIATYYHAVCGGHTASVEKIWPEKRPAPYLEGVDDGDFCAWAKSYSWTESYTPEQLKEAFTRYFKGRGIARDGDFEQIRNIAFRRSEETGRVDLMTVTTATGVFKEECDKIRWAIGRSSVPGAILPSTHFNYNIEMAGDTLAGMKINGTGNGHGIGMCQCGAIGRSRAGFKYDEILKHYYKHVKVAKIY
jgi:stage II sporulation protein D